VTHQQTFDALAQADGKSRYVPAEPYKELFDEQLDAFKRWMTKLANMFWPGKQLPIYVDYIDDGTFNAWAAVYEKVGFVGLNKGAVLLPFEMFARHFSHPRTLLLIGNAELEQIGPQHSEGMATNYDQLVVKRIADNRPILATPPNDFTRKVASNLCMFAVWEFLAFHELTHILHGHCDYWQIAGKHKALLEVAGDPSENRGQHMLRQAIETYADSSAVSVTLSHVLGPRKMQPGNDFPNRHRLYLWCYAIFGLFRIWGFTMETPTRKLDESDYPPTTMRYMMAMDTAKLHVQQYFPALYGDFDADCNRAEVDFDNDLMAVGGLSLLPSAVEGATGIASQLHMNWILQIMRETLAPALVPHHYLKIDPPQ
jgi:hypothetical protein